MAKKVKLLGFWPSPFSRRVELALRIKGVEFDYGEEDLSNKSSLLLESNPVRKQIPVLIHHGNPIAESLVILNYIDDAWPSPHPLLPHDPFRRATARFWATVLDDKIFKTGYKYLMTTGGEQEQEQALEEVHQQLELLQNELQGEFFGGESIGFVDVVGLSVIYWLQIGQEATGRLLFNEDKFSKILKWVGKICEMDVVKASLPPRDKLLAHFRARIQLIQSA